ncbi:Ribonuclease H [Planctomycetes bacterium MalM25]|nr:Ribonuclease H [Planctomycetes bacterium MalM25]
MPRYHAYAHGLSAHPDGLGSYAAIAVTPTSRRVIQHAYRHTTADRMAIRAATSALRSCPAGSSVRLYLDRRRVYDAIASGNLERWRLDSWKARVGGKPIKHADLWRDLDNAAADRDVVVALANRDDDNFSECVRLARGAAQSPLKLTDRGYRPTPTRSSRPSQRPTNRPTSRPLQAGDPCPKCQVSVTRREVTGQTRKPGQRYCWAWLLRCPNCGARYQTKQGRRRIESNPPSPASA